MPPRLLVKLAVKRKYMPNRSHVEESVESRNFGFRIVNFVLTVTNDCSSDGRHPAWLHSLNLHVLETSIPHRCLSGPTFLRSTCCRETSLISEFVVAPSSTMTADESKGSMRDTCSSSANSSHPRKADMFRVTYLIHRACSSTTEDRAAWSPQTEACKARLRTAIGAEANELLENIADLEALMSSALIIYGGRRW